MRLSPPVHMTTARSSGYWLKAILDNLPQLKGYVEFVLVCMGELGKRIEIAERRAEFPFERYLERIEDEYERRRESEGLGGRLNLAAIISVKVAEAHSTE